MDAFIGDAGARGEKRTSLQVSFAVVLLAIALLLALAPCRAEARTFTDVSSSDYWYKAVYAVADAGYMTGKTDTYFGATDSLTRANMVTVLWRICCPEEAAAYTYSVRIATTNTTGLDDVEDGMYYTAAANWAVENGIVTGKIADDGTRYFDPNGKCTFQQFCTMLARCLAGGESALSSSLTDEDVEVILATFTDEDKIADYARTAVAWCIENGAVSGKANGSIAPTENISRGRAATVIYKAMNALLLGLEEGTVYFKIDDDDCAIAILYREDGTTTWWRVTCTDGGGHTWKSSSNHTCTVCGLSFNSSLSAHTHTWTETSGSWQCSVCGRLVTTDLLEYYGYSSIEEWVD